MHLPQEGTAQRSKVCVVRCAMDTVFPPHVTDGERRHRVPATAHVGGRHRGSRRSMGGAGGSEHRLPLQPGVPGPLVL